MKVKDPFCPKCGCPPRFVLGTFQVRVGVSAQGDRLVPTGEKRVGKPVGHASLILECGGCHQWVSTELPA